MTDNSIPSIQQLEDLLCDIENEISEIQVQQDKITSTQTIQLSSQERMAKDANDIISKLNDLGYKTKAKPIKDLKKLFDAPNLLSSTVCCLIIMDAKHIALSDNNGSVYVYNINIDAKSFSSQFTHVNAHASAIRCMLVWNTNLITACDKGVINVWEIHSKQLTLSLCIENAHSDVITNVILLSNGDIATASYDNSVKVWNFQGKNAVPKHVMKEDNRKAYSCIEVRSKKVLAVSYGGNNSGRILMYSMLNLNEEPYKLKDDKVKDVYTTCHGGMISLHDSTIAVIASKGDGVAVFVIDIKKPGSIVAQINDKNFTLGNESGLVSLKEQEFVYVMDGWFCQLSVSSYEKLYCVSKEKELKGTAMRFMDQSGEVYAIACSDKGGFIVYKVEY